MSGESYTGVKFAVIRSAEHYAPTPLSKELTHWCRLFAQLGMAPSHSSGSYGNLSVRLSPGKPQFLITRTSAMLSDITEEELVQVNAVSIEQKTIETQGMSQPSSETFIHAMLYQQRPDVNAIFHGHSDALLAMQQIPATPDELPYGTIELAEAALILKDNPLFNLKNHGFFSLASTMQLAASQVIDLIK